MRRAVQNIRITRADWAKKSSISFSSWNTWEFKKVNIDWSIAYSLFTVAISSYRLMLQVATSLDLDFSQHFWHSFNSFQASIVLRTLMTKQVPVCFAQSYKTTSGISWVLEWLPEQCKSVFAQPYLCETFLYSKREMKRRILSRIILQHCWRLRVIAATETSPFSLGQNYQWVP